MPIDIYSDAYIAAANAAADYTSAQAQLLGFTPDYARSDFWERGLHGKLGDFERVTDTTTPDNTGVGSRKASQEVDRVALSLVQSQWTLFHLLGNAGRDDLARTAEVANVERWNNVHYRATAAGVPETTITIIEVGRSDAAKRLHMVTR